MCRRISITEISLIVTLSNQSHSLTHSLTHSLNFNLKIYTYNFYQKDRKLHIGIHASLSLHMALSSIKLRLVRDSQPTFYFGGLFVK